MNTQPESGGTFKGIVKKLVPASWLAWWYNQRRVRWGNFRRVSPLGHRFVGPWREIADRYYIEKFLAAYQGDIKGRVLEVEDNYYTKRFGGNRITCSDVLYNGDDSAFATIIADLTCAETIDSNVFDCIILTQTLQYIYNTRAALGHLARILKPEGVLLVTVPGIAPLSPENRERWGEYWRFTSMSARKMFEEFFPSAHVSVRAYGNVLVATALLHSLRVRDLTSREFDYQDSCYEVIVAIRAVK